MLKILKKHPIKVALLCIFVVIQYLNFTGFCYSEMRYLSKEELLKSLVEYRKNPNCCSIYDLSDRDMNYFLNNFFARHFYGLVIIIKRDLTQYDDPREKYERRWSSISSCGHVYPDYSENLTEEQI